MVLFTSGSQSLRRTRRRVVRRCKAWNKQYTQPGFSSHKLTVWAWEVVEAGHVGEEAEHFPAHQATSEVA